MEHLYGFTREQALGQIAHRMLRTMFPAATADIDAALLSEHSWQGAVIHRHADGRAILVSSNWGLTDGTETLDTVIVTEVHTETASTAVADVIAIIASELSEPLTAIANYVAGARQTLERAVPDQVIVLHAMSLAADQTVRGTEHVKLLRGLAQDLRRSA
jgi:hypothetical protein